MEHVMFVQEVKADKRDEYIKRHREAWPELLTAIRECGIEREMIWMHGDYICIYAMAEHFEKSMAALVKTPIFTEWLAVMEPLLAQIQDYSGDANIMRLENVFDLEKQLKEAGK